MKVNWRTYDRQSGFGQHDRQVNYEALFFISVLIYKVGINDYSWLMTTTKINKYFFIYHRLAFIVFLTILKVIEEKINAMR